MITSSDTLPEPIYVDLIQDGKARVMVRYNIKEVLAPTLEIGDKKGTGYQYEEKVVWIDVPKDIPATKKDMSKVLDKMVQSTLDLAKTARDEIQERPTQPPVPPILIGRF